MRENRLISAVITDEHVRRAIEEPGRGWIIEVRGEVVAFAVGNSDTGNVWALFVDPEHECQGFGRLLHDTMIQWLASKGIDRFWLTTEPGTRAQRFYEAAGWTAVGTTERGEIRYEKTRSV